MLDVSRKVVPDKGSLNRERPVTKVRKFPSSTRKIFFLRLNWSEVCEKECIQRETTKGMVAGYNKQQNKTKTENKSGYLKK